jgi:signal transduction histidine kinase/ActR/RegA family two-component response regulator
MRLLLLRGAWLASVLLLRVANPESFTDQILTGPVLAIVFVVGLALPLFPVSLSRAPSFGISVACLDVALTSVLVLQADPAGRLPLFFILLLVASALSTRIAHILTGCTALSALYLLVCGLGGADDLQSLPHLAALPFFYATALHLGSQTLRLGAERARANPAVREANELRAIVQALESGESALDLHGAMFNAVCRIADAVETARCSVLLVKAGGAEEAFVLASHDARGLSMLPLDLAKYPEVRLALSRKDAVLIEDVESSELMRPHLEHLRRLNYRTILAQPILHRGSPVGALCLRAATKHAFSRDDIRLCRNVAAAAAAAITIDSQSNALQEIARTQQVFTARVRGLFDHSPDLILHLQADGTISDANTAAQHLSGRSRAEILSTPLTSLIRGLPSMEILRDRTLRLQAPLLHEAKLLASGNIERDLAVTVGATGAQGGDLILIGRDVTDQRKTAAMLQHAEKLSSIGEIVASIAHELNNPLLGVTGSTELLARKDTEGKFKRDIDRIVEGSERCRKIIRSLLNYARPMPAEKQPIKINDVVEKTLGLLEHSLRTDHMDLVKELTPDLPDILADFHQLQQVLTNLVTNAQQAMSADKGRGRLTLRTSASGGLVILEVADDGPGITAEALPRIFDPFFSTKKQGRGTGLGLSVSHGIVRDHGGELRVETQVGQGTVFQLILPIAGAGSAIQHEKSGEREAVATKRILVVDDEESAVDLFLELLRALGHSIDAASTGQQALRKIEARDYDLVIADIKMPRMSGIELYRRVVSIKPEMRHRFVFVTGAMYAVTSEELLTLADSPCLLKPVDIEKMESTIQQVLGQMRASGQDGSRSETPQTIAGGRG